MITHSVYGVRPIRGDYRVGRRVFRQRGALLLVIKLGVRGSNVQVCMAPPPFQLGDSFELFINVELPRSKKGRVRRFIITK